MSYIEDEGRSIADALGVRYDGPQYYKEDFKFHLFTDPLTGSTFAGTSQEDSKKRLGKMRKKFGIKDTSAIPVEGSKTAPQGEDFSPPLPATIPVEVEVPGIGKIDAGIAENIQALNEAGFTSIQSCSGLILDHPEKPEFPYSGYLGKRPTGYIAFWKHQITPNKEDLIKRAAQEANLAFEEGEVFFTPAVVVRTCLLKSGIPYRVVLKEASQEAGLHVGAPDFMEKLEIRDEIMKRKFQENGNSYLQDTDEKAKAAWDKFTKILVGGKVHVSSTHPLVLERFAHPAPDQMELGGDIGKIQIVIPPPRGSKVEEGSVIRTSEKHDKAVEHLGYHSVSLSDEEVAALETKVPTDIEIIQDSQRRLQETQVIPDNQLNSSQLAHLNLAREIARKVGCIPPGGIHAAVIPAASDRVRTAGLYGTKSGALYLCIDMISKCRDACDTLIHELGHHRQYTGTGEAEDLTPSHAAAMKGIAAAVIERLSKGEFDEYLKEVSW